MITRVQVKNFRSLADVDVALGPLTVLVGRNGVGKSTFLEALRFVRDALRTNLEEAVSNRDGIEMIRRWSPNEPCEIEIALTGEEVDYQNEKVRAEYSFTILTAPNGDYRISQEQGRIVNSFGGVKEEFRTEDGIWLVQPRRLVFDQTKVPPLDSRSLVLPSLRAFSLFYPLLNDLVAAGFYDISPHALRPPQQLSNDEWLADNAENLAAVLRRLCQDEKSKQKILIPLARVAEGVSDIRVQRVGGYLVTELKHADIGRTTATNGTPAWFELNQESDGTLRFLGMLVALNQNGSSGQRLIALEEPETSLHPGVLPVIGEELLEASARRQILVTTQSPDLISRFSVDELRVVERIAGATQIGLVDEVQRETINEQLFSAGDLLRIEGLRRASAETAGGRRA
ncbi:MAG TPA: AAA family ATPase [Blastocatellia bacterium]|nr:AAA family ATPase [Blastocatellia bacterium]HMX28540.1 AAA family ATPase [Blastocatellia bacterium]HMZ19431.1 AAA family ATPase [Blastocatellia bacterium]HNG32398.1 AAA family ATPase [Blastocatellia bacterium]